MIAGVCGGISEYLQIDVTWVRLAFALLAIFGGIGLLAYIVLVVIMPLPAERATTTGVVAADGTTDLTETARPLRPAPDPADMERRRRFAGYVLIAVGVIFLLGNQGLFRFMEWRFVWPVALVAVGVLLLVQRSRR